MAENLMNIFFSRVHAETVPSYELASTRKFCRGRTEVIRTTTPEVLYFVHIMIDESNTTEQEKVEAMLRAADTLTTRAKEVIFHCNSLYS